MNIKAKINARVRAGYSREIATVHAIEEAQNTINDMDEKLSRAIEFLSADQVREIYGNFENT